MNDNRGTLLASWTVNATFTDWHPSAAGANTDADENAVIDNGISVSFSSRLRAVTTISSKESDCAFAGAASSIASGVLLRFQLDFWPT